MNYNANEMFIDVSFFNLAAKGTEPVYSPEDQGTFDRLARQLALLQEEVDETSVAIQEKDKAEVLKEVLDVGVVWMHDNLAIVAIARVKVMHAVEAAQECGLATAGWADQGGDTLFI